MMEVRQESSLVVAVQGVHYFLPFCIWKKLSMIQILKINVAHKCIIYIKRYVCMLTNVLFKKNS